MSSKIKITVSFEIEDDWYKGQCLTKWERNRKYLEEFGDIEVLWNHIPKYGYDVSIEGKR